jgi:hypothetical protein
VAVTAVANAGDILIADIVGDVQEYLRNIGTSVDKQMVTALMAAALHAEGELKQTIAELFSEGGTGNLSRNPKAMLIETDGAIKSAGAFLDLVYAGIQDRGGVVRAKSVKYLAIPLTKKAATPGKWPRTWAPKALTFIKSKKGNKLLVEIRGKGKRAKIYPQYVLKRSVAIRGKGYVERANRAAAAGIIEIIGRNVRFAIQRERMPT